MTWIDLLALTAIGQTHEHPLTRAYEVRDLAGEVRALAAGGEFHGGGVR